MRLEISDRIKSIYSRICVLEKELAGIRKREAAENGNVENYLQRIRKLDDLAEQSLSGGDNDYAKFKTSVRRLNELLGVSKEILGKIQGVRKPLEDELRTHKHNLGVLLTVYITDYRWQIDKEIEPLLDSLIRQIEEFLKDCKAIYEGYGLMFLENQNLIPCRVPIDFLEERRRKERTHKAEAPETPKAPLSPELVSAPPEAPETPSGSETQSEGTWIPPEPVSQAAAAPGAVPVEEAEAPVESDETPPVDQPPSPAVPLVDEDVWGEPEEKIAESQSAGPGAFGA
jgi:hypothetical protein